MALLSQRDNDGGEIAFARERHDVGRARTFPPHAHVERSVQPERKSALGLVDLHGRNAEVEHYAVDRGNAVMSHKRFEIREAPSGKQEPALRLFNQRSAGRDRAFVAVNEHRPRIAAAAECGVEIDAAVAHGEPFLGAARQHRNMASRSASDSRADVARHHFCAPSGFAAAARTPDSVLKARTLSVASDSSARKRPGSHIRNLWPRPTKTTASVIRACVLRASVSTTRPSLSIFSVSLVP